MFSAKYLICVYNLFILKKIGNGIAEGYFNQIKDAHQLVLQAQLTRLERLQSRFPSAPRNSSDSLNIEQDTNFSEGD